jgi:O-antigen/teichoic acid export membrane protein
MLKKYASFIDQTLVSGGNFLTVAICAHFLPLEEQGKFIYAFSSYIGLVLLNVSGIFQGAAVRAPTQGPEYEAQLAKLQCLVAILCAVLIAMFWFVFGGYFGWSLSIVDLSLLFSFFAIQQVADFNRRSSYIFSSALDATISSAILYPIRIIILLVIQPSNIDLVLLILITSAIFPAILSIRTIGKLEKDSKIWLVSIKEHLYYSRLFIAGSLISWLWSYAPVFILGMMQGKAAAALLASIRGISSAANIFMEQLETKAVADWARLFHQEGLTRLSLEVKRLNQIAFVFWVSVMLGIIFFDKAIVTIILGDLYSSFAYILDIAWIGYGAFYIARVHGIWCRTLGNNKIEFISNAFGFIAAILGSCALIPLFNIEGAAWVYFVIPTAIYLVQLMIEKKYPKIFSN